jgi:hypothetical protein
MRPDQITMLNELSEKLADVFLQEGDPANWSGAGKLPVDLTRDERGDRKWDKANAMATGGVLRYVMDITSAARKNEVESPPEGAERESDLDRQIKEAQARAAEAMKRVMGKPVGSK